MSDGNDSTGQEWLKARLVTLGMSSIVDLETVTGINRGTLSRYFRQLQRPSIDVVPVLCDALRVSPLTLLRVLGVTVKESSVD
jgi:transcriptional regulator with XRE-family HTH domain